MIRVFVVVISLLCFSIVSFAQKPTYIGAAGCKPCHKGPSKGEVYEKWEKSTHAKAFETLKAKKEDKNPKCLGCHVTGFKAGGYKVGDPKASKFEGVQCESCHGPGSVYKSMSIMKDKKKALASGLVEPNEALCVTCHNKKSPTFKGFNFAEAVKQIDHSYVKK